MQKLTGGTVVSRNKEFIVFYRGNDYLPPVVTEALKERQKQTDLQQDEEDQARQRALALIKPKAKASKGPLVAGTLAETMAATSRWGNQPSSEDVQKMIRDSALTRHALLVRYLQNKLALVSYKIPFSSSSVLTDKILNLFPSSYVYLILNGPRAKGSSKRLRRL
jgi:hypothetical protein